MRHHPRQRTHVHVRTRKHTRGKLKLTLRGTYRPNGIEISLARIRRIASSLAQSIERYTGSPCDVDELLRDVNAPTRIQNPGKVMIITNPHYQGRGRFESALCEENSPAVDKIAMKWEE